MKLMPLIYIFQRKSYSCGWIFGCFGSFFERFPCQGNLKSLLKFAICRGCRGRTGRCGCCRTTAASTTSCTTWSQPSWCCYFDGYGIPKGKVYWSSNSKFKVYKYFIIENGTREFSVGYTRLVLCLAKLVHRFNNRWRWRRGRFYFRQRTLWLGYQRSLVGQGFFHSLGFKEICHF